MARRYPDIFYGDTGRYNYRVGGKFSKPTRSERDQVWKRVYRFAGKDISARLENAIHQFSREFTQQHLFAGTPDVPQDTKNLLDGTFVVGWYPTTNRLFVALGPHDYAEKPQHWGFNAELETFAAGKGYVRDLWDEMDLNEQIMSEVIEDAISESDAVAASLVSIAPYAMFLEEGTEKCPYYKGWFTSLVNKFVNGLQRRTSAIGLPFDVTDTYSVLARQLNILPFE